MCCEHNLPASPHSQGRGGSPEPEPATALQTPKYGEKNSKHQLPGPVPASFLHRPYSFLIRPPSAASVDLTPASVFGGKSTGEPVLEKPLRGLRKCLPLTTHTGVGHFGGRRRPCFLLACPASPVSWSYTALRTISVLCTLPGKALHLVSTRSFLCQTAGWDLGHQAHGIPGGAEVSRKSSREI